MTQEFSTLSEAVRADDLAYVKTAVLNDPNLINTALEVFDNLTLLLYAAKHGAQRIIEYLFEDEKVDLDQQDSDGRTALCHAIFENKVNVATYLANKKVDKPDGSTLFFLVIIHDREKNNMTENIRKIVRAHPDLARKKSNDCGLSQYFIHELDLFSKANIEELEGLTLLSFATVFGDINIVKLLIELGGDVNEASDNGSFPLHWAAWSCSLDIVQFLIEVKNVDVNLKNTKNTSTSLYFAAQEDKLKVIEYLLTRQDIELNPIRINDQSHPLHVSAKNGAFNTVKRLVQTPGVNVNLIDDQGRTPLIRALEEKQCKVAEYLIQIPDLDPNIKRTRDLNTALHIATRDGLLSPAISLLKRPDVDKNPADSTGHTPLLLALKRKHDEILECLIQILGTRPHNIIPPYQSPILHIAARNGLDYTLQYLDEEWDADLNATDNSGLTPLHHAAEGNAVNAVKVVRYLLMRGADAGTRTPQGKTAHEIAIENKREEIASILKEPKRFREQYIKNRTEVAQSINHAQGYMDASEISNSYKHPVKDVTHTIVNFLFFKPRNALTYFQCAEEKSDDHPQP